jgi:hypothetical protein
MIASKYGPSKAIHKEEPRPVRHCVIAPARQRSSTGAIIKFYVADKGIRLAGENPARYAVA